MIHVTELTQPLGHSTSGSHERYKSKERLNWEKNHDCNLKFREWILSNGISDEYALNKIESEIKTQGQGSQKTKHGKPTKNQFLVKEINSKIFWRILLHNPIMMWN